jgi:hypothetical protein
VSAQHQRQEHHQDETRWVPTPSISDFDPTPQAYEVPDEPPEDATSSYDDGPLDPELAPRLLYQPPTPSRTTHMQPAPHLTGTTQRTSTTTRRTVRRLRAPTTPTRSPNAITRSSSSCASSSSRTTQWGAGQRRWKDGIGIQGEYTHLTTQPHQPASPAPQHQPPPPITIYVPPRINYAPPPTRHRPPRTHNTSRRPPLRPYTRPQRVRRPPRENRTGHVTATQRDGFRATTRATRRAASVYVPPALRNDGETPYRSQQPSHGLQDVLQGPTTT